MAGRRFYTWLNGMLELVRSVVTSSGAEDAGEIPALNDNGILDPSIINSSKNGGTGNESKVAQMNDSGFLNPSILNAANLGGDPNAEKIAQLDITGRLAASMMPVNFGQEISVYTFTENVVAGDLINIYNDNGVKKARLADAATLKQAHGYVRENIASGSQAEVWSDGINTFVLGLETAGDLYLSWTTPGKISTTPPAEGSGFLYQEVGYTASATSMIFERGFKFKLASS